MRRRFTAAAVAVALFARPFRADRGRRERNERPPAARSGAACGSGCDGCAAGYGMGPHTRLHLQQALLAWDPEMDEVPDRPPFMLMSDPYFTVYQGRRRAMVTGEAPAGIAVARPPQARDWRTYQSRMTEEPPWDRAVRYQRLMKEKGYRSIRALAKAIGEDHSRVARVLKILDLPKAVLAALREHAGDVHVRAHFTEKRLRKLAGRTSEAKILREITQVVQAHA